MPFGLVYLFLLSLLLLKSGCTSIYALENINYFRFAFPVEVLLYFLQLQRCTPILSSEDIFIFFRVILEHAGCQTVHKSLLQLEKPILHDIIQL